MKVEKCCLCGVGITLEDGEWMPDDEDGDQECLSDGRGHYYSHRPAGWLYVTREAVR